MRSSLTVHTLLKIITRSCIQTLIFNGPLQLKHFWFFVFCVFRRTISVLRAKQLRQQHFNECADSCTRDTPRVPRHCRQPLKKRKKRWILKNKKDLFSWSGARDDNENAEDVVKKASKRTEPSSSSNKRNKKNFDFHATRTKQRAVKNDRANHKNWKQHKATLFSWGSFGLCTIFGCWTNVRLKLEKILMNFLRLKC